MVSYSSPFQVVFDMEAGYADVFNQPSWSFRLRVEQRGGSGVRVGVALGLGVGMDRGCKNLLALCLDKVSLVQADVNQCHRYDIWPVRETVDCYKILLSCV